LSRSRWIGSAPRLFVRQPFDVWLADLVTEARARGYSDERLDQTLAG
jgi:hypothetical protein